MNGPKLEDIARLAALSVGDAVVELLGPPFWVAFTKRVYEYLVTDIAQGVEQGTYIWSQVKHLGSLHLLPTLKILSSQMN